MWRRPEKKEELPAFQFHLDRSARIYQSDDLYLSMNRGVATGHSLIPSLR